MASRTARRRGVASRPVGVVFSEDFTATSVPFSKWLSCQWNAGGSIRNDNCQTYNGTSDYSATVANGGTDHERAARFEVRDGDSPFSGTERAEIAEAPGTNVVPGDARRIEWDMKFDSSFPVPHASSSWSIPWQWHGNAPGSSPPLCLDISGGAWGTADNIYLANNHPGISWRTSIQAMVRDTWQHWKVETLFSDNGAVGYVHLWVDGVEKIALTSRQTMVTGDTGNYFKCGLYRDPVNTATAILWHDNIVMTRI